MTRCSGWKLATGISGAPAPGCRKARHGSKDSAIHIDTMPLAMLAQSCVVYVPIIAAMTMIFPYSIATEILAVIGFLFVR